MSEEIEDYLSASGAPDPSGSSGRAGEILTAVAMVGAEIGDLRAHLGDVLKDVTALRGDVTELGQAAGITRLAAEVHELAAHIDQRAGDEDTKTPAGGHLGVRVDGRGSVGWRTANVLVQKGSFAGVSAAAGSWPIDEQPNAHWR